MEKLGMSEINLTQLNYAFECAGGFSAEGGV